MTFQESNVPKTIYEAKTSILSSYSTEILYFSKVLFYYGFKLG